jgi:hypothetical protein
MNNIGESAHSNRGISNVKLLYGDIIWSIACLFAEVHWPKGWCWGECLVDSTTNRERFHRLYHGHNRPLLIEVLFYFCCITLINQICFKKILLAFVSKKKYCSPCSSVVLHHYRSSLIVLLVVCYFVMCSLSLMIAIENLIQLKGCAGKYATGDEVQLVGLLPRYSSCHLFF